METANKKEHVTVHKKTGEAPRMEVAKLSTETGQKKVAEQSVEERKRRCKYE